MRINFFIVRNDNKKEINIKCTVSNCLIDGFLAHFSYHFQSNRKDGYDEKRFETYGGSQGTTKSFPEQFGVHD